ncbi:hypothetical protein O4N82_10815 [Vibrio parahaemolyticus]|uniref:hypothetical protein n=1 Tax=Vibrio TaxID=662 RepID=UPI00052D4833|nr:MULTISPECIES: hypothetical protein [Vibrio]KGK15105.1 hypothetical protein DC58_04405 [Vibrio navarrensis]MBH9742485.1 hypothetical protein [Vibrio navarrensis]MCZ6402217.1 hypothetical protein [Vibrio parahaemolyticus]TNZ67318.1 hypothetical protein CGK42_21755 [Vibrio parahaemolyticus]HAS6506061.1 hypothetical protein [Vibrio parahaemolyticus]
MEHIVEIIKALAWPVAIVWLGYMFRNEVRSLIGRLTALKHGDTEISFNRSLEKVEQKASEISQPQESSHESTPEELSQKEQLYRLAEISPRAAIVEAWTLIETAAVKSDLTTGVAFKRTTPKLILEHLASTGNFSPKSIEVINSLRQLRNKASHLPDFAISQEEAERYLDLAIKSAHAIENIAS